MTPRLRRVQSAARARRALGEIALWLPIVAVAIYAAQRAGRAVTIGVSIVALVALAWRIVVRIRGIDRAWLVRGLDRRDRGLQDSADLLFADPVALGELQRLQRERVLQTLETQAAPDLREPMPAQSIALAWLAAAIAVAGLYAWKPATRSAPDVAPPAAAVAAPVPQSLTATLRIQPPAYTGAPVRSVETLAARVEAGSVVSWELHFAHEPKSARLRFVEGEALELALSEGRWRASRTLETSALYRVEIEGAPALPAAPAARIDVIPDRAPQIKMLRPDRTLTVLDAQTRDWTLVFDASDDYGLGATQLELVLAQGSGEQVSISERRIALTGKGDARRRHFEHRIDLAAFGFVQGDDLIAAVQVSDNRAPKPNTARSPSFILRWPPPPAMEGTGVEGLVQKVMPAYFRSQRQIIIDTEALIAKRAQLAPDVYVVESDVIGADQRLLRLRYGQFLGEESETEGEAHDEGPGGPPASVAQDLMADAGHMHDLPEAATLLDPGTRSLLRSALDAMWQAERELRTGNPVAALPHENAALEFIKRAQQADRIYLARVGLDLPPLDAARRLTGDRGNLAGRSDPTRAAAGEHVPEDAWSALQSGAMPDLDALSAWIARERDTLEDPLVLLEQLDAVRRDAACVPCREQLARALWPVLEAPAAAASPRARPDKVGADYLDAIAVPEPSK